MKTSATRQSTEEPGKFRCTAWQRNLFLLVLLLLCVPAADLQAAKISLAPNDLTVNVAPGEVVSIPVTATLSETSVPNSYALFSFSHAGGNLDPTWVNSRVYVSLSVWALSRQAVLRVSPPPNAKGGAYSATFRTVLLNTNESVDAEELLIKVNVDAQTACNQAPLFSDITSTHDSIDARNNKQVDIGLGGTISVTDGCGIDHAWYQLTDEYGEMDQQQDIVINADGSFSTSVPMIASRKGNDKDGRLYTVKFLAENEAGVGESSATSIVVTHDNRKK